MSPPTPFPTFLAALLDVTADPAGFRPAIRRGPPDAADRGTTIAVGVGSWPEDDTEWPAHFLLNQKLRGDSTRFAPARPRSAAELVRDQADRAFRIVASWRDRATLRLADRQGLEDFLTAATLRVEDASPDSVLAVLLLLARLAGVAQEDLPDAWVRAATRWETASGADSMSRGWAPLAVALVEFLNLESEGEYREAWRLGLHFTAAAMARGEDPQGLSDGFLAGPGALAVQRRGAVRLRYEALLRDATRYQLMLPMAGSGDPGHRRHRLADALVIYQSAPIGNLKDEARADTVNAPLGNGFEVLVYLNPREAERGSGDAVTISVSPGSHLDLTGVWQALEDRETEEWGGPAKRPADQPRNLGLPDGTAPRWNQPWFPLVVGEPGARRTELIGSPKALADGRPGRRLKFRDIEDVLWQAGAPGRYARVSPRADGGAPVPLPDLPADEGWLEAAERELGRLLAAAAPAPGEASDRPTLFISHYARAGDAGNTGAAGADDSAVAFSSETLVRTIAARLECPNGAPTLLQVKTRRQFERIPLTAGFAVVSAHGAWVHDDWTDDHFDGGELQGQFAACVAAGELLREAGRELDRIGADLDDYVGGRPQPGLRRKLLRGQRLLRDLALCRGALSRISGLLARRGRDRDSEDFRAALVRLWGLREQRDEAASRIAAFEESIRSAETARSKAAVELLANGGLVIGATALFYDPLKKIPELARAAIGAGKEQVKCDALAKADPPPGPVAAPPVTGTASPSPPVAAPAATGKAVPAGMAAKASKAAKPAIAGPGAETAKAGTTQVAGTAAPLAEKKEATDCEAIARIRMEAAVKASPGTWVEDRLEGHSPAWDPAAAALAALIGSVILVALIRLALRAFASARRRPANEG